MTGMATNMRSINQEKGQNALELLLFKLAGRQRFGINVFKVKEILTCPLLTDIPGSHAVVRGSAHMRGQTVPVMDLCMAVGGPRMKIDENATVIITECNRQVVGFLVSGVERIVNINWSLVMPPPAGLGRNDYLTAITTVDDDLVEIIDVERVLSEVLGSDDTVSAEVVESAKISGQHFVLVVDDSEVARNQVKRVLEQIGVESVSVKDGQEAFHQLKAWQEGDGNEYANLALVISDIEMPQMDGYTLVSNIRSDPALSETYIVLHSSLSGNFNESMVKKVGANQFLSKFEPDELALLVQARMKECQATRPI